MKLLPMGKIEPRCGVVQARGVGGNGILSSMVYMRALPADIEAWGLPKWTWERMFGLYKDLEHYTGHDDGSGVHGTCSSASDPFVFRLFTEAL